MCLGQSHNVIDYQSYRTTEMVAIEGHILIAALYSGVGRKSFSGRYAVFFKRAMAPRHFLLLVKGTLRENCKLLLGAFQGYQGNDQGALRQSPSLSP